MIMPGPMEILVLTIIFVVIPLLDIVFVYPKTSTTTATSSNLKYNRKEKYESPPKCDMENEQNVKLCSDCGLKFTQ